jgi:hypothetical protein
VTRLRTQRTLTGLGINGKQGIHLGHDPQGGLVLGIEFDRLEELSARMSPASYMHDILSPNMVVSPVAVALQPALKVAQEAFRTLPV